MFKKISGDDGEADKPKGAGKFQSKERDAVYAPKRKTPKSKPKHNTKKSLGHVKGEKP